MPRNKKNKGNSASTPQPNSNKAKSPAEPTAPEPVLTSTPETLPSEREKSNDDLKVRLANAKERLHLLQEVIGGIGDPTDVDNLKASGIDAAKEKLNIIEDSVNAVKSTLLEVRQETARSVTPEGGSRGTSKRRKNKKHNNQNPPQGFVVQEQSSADNAKIKLETDETKNESGTEQEDGTSTLSKKKRNRNKKKKAQQEQAQNSAPESPAQDVVVSSKNTNPIKIVEPQTDLKENTTEGNKSKNNKKNKNKEQPKHSTELKVETDKTVEKSDQQADVGTTSQQNQNKNKKQKGGDNNKDVEKPNTLETKAELPLEGKVEEIDENNKKRKTDSTVKLDEEIAVKKETSPKPKDGPPSPKQNEKHLDNTNTKDHSNKAKKDQKKRQNVEEKLASKVELTETPKPAEGQLKQEKVVSSVIENAQETKAKYEPAKTETGKNKKDKRKGQSSDSKETVVSKVDKEKAEPKENVFSEKTSRPIVEAPLVLAAKTETIALESERKVINVELKEEKNDQPAIESTNQQDKKTEIGLDKTTTEQVTTPIAVEKDKEKPKTETSSSRPQSEKNKKNKNATKKTDKEEGASIVELELTTDKILTEIIADVSKTANKVQSEEAVPSNEENNEKSIKEAKDTWTSEVAPKSPEKLETTTIQSPLDLSTKAMECLKKDLLPAEIAKSIENKTETTSASGTIPPLPKLDFSQVVKDNKDKIPLMEVKPLPVPTSLPSAVEAKEDFVIKPITDAANKISTSIETVTTTPKTIVSDLVDIIAGTTTAPLILDASVPVKQETNVPYQQDSPAVEASTTPKQTKAKTPERKGNQKNEQKKCQQVKVQKKQDDQKAQVHKKEEDKNVETNKVVSDNKVDKPTKVDAPPKVETKSVLATTNTTEIKSNEDISNIEKEQELKKVAENLNIKSVEATSKDGVKEKDLSIKSTEKLHVPDNADLNKKVIGAVVATDQLKVAPQTSSKPESLSPQKPASNRQLEQQKQESKKDQKKNKMKGKAPQPPDIPMDMSLLSASMIDSPSAEVDEIIPHSESEDQSSLITSDSKNVLGSDFVPSAECSLNKVIKDETKSLEGSSLVAKNDNEVTEIIREQKNASPTSNKRNKDVANLKECDEMQEAKRQELPEKSAQQKLEPVQFPAVQLMDILEAKMTSPTVKPGHIAGNVRKLLKDNKRADQLNIQQQKSRSKSPKENMAEKYVKIQKLATGTNNKEAAQNLKKEILNNEVRSLVTPITKEKEAKPATEIDANLHATENKPGTAPTTAVTETKQVENRLIESDVHSKQKAETLPENATIPDTKSKDAGKTQKIDVAAADKDETAGTKPKIAPKPSVSLKDAPKTGDRSKKSPAKTGEIKTPKKETPVQVKQPVQAKSSVQTKSSVPSKSPVQTKSQTKPQPQSKSTSQVTSPSQLAKPSQTATSPKPETPTHSETSTVSEKPTQSIVASQSIVSPQTTLVEQSKSKNQAKSHQQTAAASSKSAAPKPNEPQCTDTKKPEVPPKPNLSANKVSPIPSPDEEEEFVEYKFTPRPVFISTACQICKVPLDTPNPCKFCQMVSYCSDEHEREDQVTHGPLCNAIQEIAKKRGGHIYNNARILNDDDYRSLRVHTLNLCENFLKRHLLPFEREMLLFPRLCCTGTCREWRQQSLVECKECGQVSYCKAHPEHLPETHGKWCNSYNLYQKIVLRQKNFGRIEPSLPSKIMLKPFNLSNSIDDVFKILYKNYGAIKDECIYATLTQLATAPLTALYGAQKNQQEIGEIYTIHLIGAELQFEADTLDKWETFFLHLVPSLVECRVVFVGPELNAENLPLEILSRIRMCRTCRQNCRIVKFDFQCGILYHDYVNSSAFTKPDLVCFFNPGLYRSTGFNGQDTWLNTIKSATLMNCPIVVTSYTEVESPRDLERLQKESERPLSIVQSPQINPFASQRPERNFISDEIAPMIFKNFFCFCVK